ncbi:hypothetical protein FRB94_004769 [Tulasnella sp. JGI-2019a]|nr:hypothetical protein FRB94_004769 [Tulasnella sp. JGI-2019a]
MVETPSLWARISSIYSDLENKAAITRSKDYSLWVDYCDNDRKSEEDRATFIDYASQEAYRWQSVEFAVTRANTLALLHNFVSLSVPRLEKLKIDCPKLGVGIDWAGGIDIFGGRVDRLLHLDLQFFHIPCSSQLLSQLETLKISMSNGWLDPISSSEFIDILRRCPGLREFDLQYSGEEGIRISGAIPS